jgi:hypothetical protein
MAGAALVAVPAAAPAVDDHLYACFSAPTPAAALPIGRSTRCSLRTHMTLTVSSTDLRQAGARAQPKTLFAMSRCLELGDRRSDFGNPADVCGMAIRRLADPTVSKYPAIGVPHSARRARSSGSWLATARRQQRPIGRLASTQTVRGKPSRRPALPALGHAVLPLHGLANMHSAMTAIDRQRHGSTNHRHKLIQGWWLWITGGRHQSSDRHVTKPETPERGDSVQERLTHKSTYQDVKDQRARPAQSNPRLGEASHTPTAPMRPRRTPHERASKSVAI